MKKITLIYIGQEIKCKGKWRVHNNDADPWPSDPHADRVDNRIEKLNLFNGEVLSKVTRQRLYNLTKKDMKFIYGQIMKGNLEGVKNKMKEKIEFIEYLK